MKRVYIFIDLAPTSQRYIIDKIATLAFRNFQESEWHE
jgi:hypothetical protein